MRAPIKLGLLVLALLLVMYPYPARLVRTLLHWRNPDALIDPQAPGLQPLLAELRARLNPAWDGPTTLRAVQNYVYYKIPYAWDWDTWGVADYLPTLEEVLDMGREDCDGRAVVAASLLRALGYQARLVSDTAHVWVWTPAGETMSPHAVKAVTVGTQGPEINWAGLRVLPRSLAFAVGVFPLERELIFLAVLWLVLMSPRASAGRAAACAGAILVGLVLLRYGGAENWAHPVSWAQWSGLLALLLALLLPRRRSGRRLTTPPETGPSS